MIKVSYFPAVDQHGQHVFPLFTRQDSTFEKVAAPTLRPEVIRYIEQLRPVRNSQYVLLNAMAASEYFSSNINGDAFPEESLIHRPDGWTGDPETDKELAKGWPYGFPTFYNSLAYAHHKNKRSDQSLGDVELASWHPDMKRVELVVRLDRDRCQRFGGMGAWDKLQNMQFPDVSMGTRVPYDTCSICLDWELYRIAQATFDPKRHKHPGEAVLQFHRKLLAQGKSGIRGLAVTRLDYCDHARHHMNEILPDGRKVFVYNDYPRFFDISFVFIGADKTAKVMVKIAEQQQRQLWSLPSAELACRLGYTEQDIPMEKAASDDLLKEAFLGKRAKIKGATITKDVVPSQLAGQAVPLLNAAEQDLPDELIGRMSAMPMGDVVGTTTAMGMVLRPREFQRIMLSGMGLGQEADRLEQDGVVFPKVDIGHVEGQLGGFSPALARLLAAVLPDRSAFSPFVDQRLTIVVVGPTTKRPAASHPSALLRKIGQAYDGYRKMAIRSLPEAIDKLEKQACCRAVSELSARPVEQLITPLTFNYFRDAFSDELPDKTAQASVGRRGEGRPLGEHVCHDHGSFGRTS